MAAGQPTERFIVSTFQSVWTLELLLLLKGSERPLSRTELVESLRASDAIVAKGIEALLAAGLVIDDNPAVRYAPASEDLAQRVEETAQLYRSRPDAVRRLIVRGRSGGLAAFANAFVIRGTE